MKKLPNLFARNGLARLTPCSCNSLMHELMNFANFSVDREWGNKMAARGPFVILAAVLCCDNLTISWRDKLTLNSFMKYPFQVGLYDHP